MALKIRTIATLTVELEMSAYGPEWTIADIHKQISEEAPRSLKALLSKSDSEHRLVQVGAVKVRTVVIEE